MLLVDYGSNGVDKIGVGYCMGLDQSFGYSCRLSPPWFILDYYQQGHAGKTLSLVNYRQLLGTDSGL